VSGYSTATWGSPVRAWAGNTDTFIAKLADPTPIPGPPQIIPSIGFSASHAPTCGDPPPFGIPDLFQIDVTDTVATLFYTPFLHTNSNYYISYSETLGTFHHGTDTKQGISTGVLSFTIRNLVPDTDYFLKVRGHNGCMPGAWGNEMMITTRNKGEIIPVSFYRYTH